MGALIRQAGAAGGFATILARGEATAGAVLVVIRHRDTPTAVFAKMATGAESTWRKTAEGEGEVVPFLEKQRRYDPDLWIVELDIADGERFVALSLT